MKIRLKILVSFLLTAVFFIGVSCKVYWTSDEISTLNHATKNIQTQLLAATGLRASVRNYVLDVYDAVFVSGVRGSTDPTLKARERVEVSFKEFEKAMQINGNVTWLSDVEEIRTAYSEVSTGLESIVTMARNSNFQGAKHTLQTVRDNKFKNEFLKVITELINTRTKEAQQASLRLHVSLEQLKRTVTLLTVLGILLSGLIILTMSRSIGERLASLEEAAKEISAGNLKVNLTVSGHDEVSMLSKAFNHMAHSLREAENELASQQQVMVNTSKMSALGEMAGGIAHEINTPLLIIQLRTEQIQEALEDGECDKKLLAETCQTVLETVDRIAKIIRGLRAFARDGRNDPFAAATAQTIVHGALDFCLAKIKNHGVDLRLNSATEPLILECRATEIAQVILNLINNSFDAVQALSEKWIAVDVADKSDNIEISVTDSGFGIPAEIRGKLMQPFFTTKELGKGTGLGLSVSRGIVHAHQGQLILDSLSKNTRFVILLPKKQFGREKAVA